jgi:hypothetical protein
MVTEGAQRGHFVQLLRGSVVVVRALLRPVLYAEGMLKMILCSTNAACSRWRVEGSTLKQHSECPAKMPGAANHRQQNVDCGTNRSRAAMLQLTSETRRTTWKEAKGNPVERTAESTALQGSPAGVWRP